MSIDLVMRTARPEDLDEIRRMSLLFTPGVQGMSSEEFSESYLRLLNDVGWLIGVAQDHKDVVGYILVQDYGRGLRGSFTIGRIHDLFVDLSIRRCGAGQALMEFAFNWARARPLPMILDWQASPESVPFYEALGFTADFVGDFKECPGFTLDLRPV